MPISAISEAACIACFLNAGRMARAPQVSSSVPKASGMSAVRLWLSLKAYPRMPSSERSEPVTIVTMGIQISVCQSWHRVT